MRAMGNQRWEQGLEALLMSDRAVTEPLEDEFMDSEGFFFNGWKNGMPKPVWIDRLAMLRLGKTEEQLCAFFAAEPDAGEAIEKMMSEARSESEMTEAERKDFLEMAQERLETWAT